MENLQSKIEVELLKLKNENLLSIGKKIVPEVARRISLVIDIPNITIGDVKNPVVPVQVQPSTVYLKIFERMKERFGGILAWRIPVEEYSKIVDECIGGK